MENAKKKIKVMQVNGTMNIGGIETFIMNLYRNIDRDKFDFVFLMHEPGRYDYQDEAEKLGGRFIEIAQSKPGNRLERLKQLNKVLKEEQPDVIHCHTYFDSANVMLVAKHNKVKVRITHSHTTEALKAKKKTMHRILSSFIRRYSSLLVACGTKAGLALYRHPDFDIIRNGIDLDSFTYSEKERARLRKELGIATDDIVVGHVGRLAEVKNHTFLIEIAKVIHNHNRNYKFIFVGDGPLKKDLQKKIKRYKLENTVMILGSRNDTDKLYNVFDLVVFPSLYEGIPMALIEAQANGLPVIASDTIDNEVKINDSFKFASLQLGVEKWASMIEKSNKSRSVPGKAINQYSIKEIANKMQSIYRGEAQWRQK